MTEGKDAVQGSPTMFYDGLPTRVGHLENEMSALHEDNIRTRTAISTLGSQVATLTETMKDLATKLDVTRTRRPDMAAMAAWAGVLLMIMALVYGPMNYKIDHAQSEIGRLQEIHTENSYLQGRRDKAIELLEKESK